MQLVHGGDWAGYRAEFGRDALDFSANVSPLGLPEGVARAITAALPTADRYPDPLCRELRAKLALHEGVPAEQILCGNGAADLIFRLVWARKPRRALVTAPTFAEYATALESVGCTVERFFLREQEDFAVTDAFCAAIRPGVDMVFLCQPNNPTGQLTALPLVEQILHRCAACGTLLVVDECFLDFLPDHALHTAKGLLGEGDLVILKAFTKLYGMAGVRLGYALSADTALLEQMQACGQPWGVSSLAQAAGLAALEETAGAGAAAPAAAFQAVYDSLAAEMPLLRPENPAVLFDRAAEQVCRRCILRDTCWRQNYGATYNAFNDACPQLLRRGQALPGDFPLYFTSRCVHLTEFVEAVNLELRSYLLRQQYHRRLSEVRDQAREQYAQLGDLLASAGPAVPASAQAMGYRVASSLRPREGQNVCGDQLDSFEVGGAVYLLLSDGMGSGEAAHREAAMTVRLLRQFLEAGIEPGPALKTLNTALSLRGESGGGFTTIDLLALQRSSGQAALYKYGAAPSYCKRGGSVSRYAGQSLPAGLQAVRDAPECTRLQLTAGSFFVMVSDGIADAGNDEWLQNLLAGWSGRDVNALVSLILAESRGRKGLEDDCAVLALHLSSGEKKPV